MPLDTSLVRKPFKVIGTRVRRPDGIDKVTGRAKFGADASAPGQLVGRILRSPHAHAAIKSIDVSRAEAMANLPEQIENLVRRNRPVGAHTSREIFALE